MSPELIKGGTEGHDFSVDWWSVGVLTYELLTGASPFTVDGERNTQAEISKRILRNQPPIPEHLSGQARDFIRRLLVKEPSKRLGGGQGDATQLKAHPFLASINWSLLAQRKLKAPFKPKIKHELDVSNFAEEFTSMAPHVLACSSNNQINGAAPIDEDDDDYYDSDENEQEEEEEREEEEEDREQELANNVSFRAARSLESSSSEGNLELWTRNDFIQDNQKASLSLFDNHSVIKANNNVNDIGNNSNNNNNYDHFMNCKQQAFPILCPSKHQLSFSLLAKQQQESDDQFNNAMGQVQSSNSPLIGSQISSPSQQRQVQPNGGVHFSKLFKGYSYMNPKAIEWLKQREQKCLTRMRNSMGNSLIGNNQPLSRSCQQLAECNLPGQRVGAKAVPIDEATDSLDLEDRLATEDESLRVNFTIGDGEDLTTAVRMAGIVNRPIPERLVVVKRKPSLELLYERHANRQILPTDASALNPAATMEAQHQPPVERPRLGSIQYDPTCDFFKVYHLANPLNSKRDLLGEGAYSVCKRCVNKVTGKEYAVKVMNRCYEANREIEMLRRCQGHPNIVKLYDVFQDTHNTYIVFELLRGGELLSRIRNKKRHLMTEGEICRIFRSIVASVDHLHSRRIVHRDLKPENLLFVDSSSSSELKLIDFGFARELPDSEDETIMQSPCVTLDYCAPEVLDQVISSHNDEFNYDDRASIQNQLGYDESCDLWSLGVILYAMFSGRLPFKDSNASRPLGPINAKDVRSAHLLKLDGPEWSEISEAPKEIVRGLLETDLSKRMTIQQLLHNDWMLNFDQQDSGKSLKRKNAGPNCKTPGAITMTLRKRVIMSVKSSISTPPAKSTGTIDDDTRPKKPLKRSLDNHSSAVGSSNKSSGGHKRTKLAESTGATKVSGRTSEKQAELPLDSKWLSRFVQIGRTNKDNLRITFRALNNHHGDLVSASANRFLFDSQQPGTGYEIPDMNSSPSSSPSSNDFGPSNSVNGWTTSSSIYSNDHNLTSKRQVKRLKLHYHDRFSAGSTGTTIYTKSTDSYA